jgi:hypothetical protein
MRIFLDSKYKKRLLDEIKLKNKCKTLSELSKKIGINKKTLEGWFYLEKSSLPYELLKAYLNEEIKIIRKKEDNWGQINGGKRGQEIIIKKYGRDGLRKMQVLGGKHAAKTKDNIAKQFKVEIDNPLFLEFYGSLLGDGWLNSTKSKEGRWGIGLCGNLKLDKEYINYCKKNINNLFNRKGYIIEKNKGNAIEFRFKHKWLFKFLNEEINFPYGKKENLEIHNSIYLLEYNKLRYVIRGIFDTDGTFYLGKNKRNIPSFPIIAIHMNEPKLIKQIGEILIKNNFSINYSDHGKMIRMHGKDQLIKWMNEISSSNPKHINKINNFLSVNT